MEKLSWVEISKSALQNNIIQFRNIITAHTILCPCIKANAYGHGLVETAGIFLNSGADWLSVNALYEAKSLRQHGINCPVYILGYVPLKDIAEAIDLDCTLVVYDYDTINMIGETAKHSSRTVRVHVKVETGTNRQGIEPDKLLNFVQYIKKFKNIGVEGLSTHFANIEGTTDHSHAELQLRRFNKASAELEASGLHIPLKHCANSAAAIIFPETRFQMIRPGISCYGMWPSNETREYYTEKIQGNFHLTPAFTWKTKITQIKTVPKGEYIGYGCTYKTTHNTRLAVLPVGYYDGYDRGISGGHVLVHGEKAPIRGRICMNIIMVEITDIPEAKTEDEVILIGKDGNEAISAEQVAEWADTINYEVTTRVNDRIPRILVE